MTIINDSTGPSDGLVTRVKNILLTPKPEWARIDVEPATIKSLYVGYICILAAIPPLASLIGGLVFGHGIPGLVSYRPPIVSAVVGAVVTYALSLLAVAIIALVIEALAPSFGARKDRVQAFKVAGYSYTAAWVAGALNIFPPLFPIVLLISLYGFYLLYLGLIEVMKAPADKAIGYTAVSVIAAIVATWIVMAVVGMMTVSMAGLGVMGMAHATRATDGGVVTVAGHQLDVGKMQAAAEQLEAAQRGGGAAVTTVPASTLQGYLPAALAGGYARTEMGSSSADAGGIGGSTAEASYRRGDSSIRLNVTDMAAAGALASMGAAMNVSSSRETGSSYEKVGKVDGRMTTESYDRDAKSGKYAVIVGDRFLVEAEGDQVAMDDLKRAVASVDPGRLEGLSRG